MGALAVRLSERQKWEVAERVRLALQSLPPELRRGKRYSYARQVARIVVERDNKKDPQ